MSTLERAISLAVQLHAGQIDKAGAPYILHPLRVMFGVRGEAEQMAAVLHDVVEDGDVSLDQLRELGFPEPVVIAVDSLTKRDHEHGAANYLKFVERAGQNDIARVVKLADIADNMDRSRISAPTAKDSSRLGRYYQAKKLLEAIGRERGDSRLTAPTILALKNRVTAEEVEAECPGARPIVACDFYVDGAEKGATTESGPLHFGRIVNVDHHAPISRMQRVVTSTQLAREYLASLSDSPAPWVAPWVVINHTDCDSVLSSALMMGFLEPDDDLVGASIAADHTGAANAIADLLQGLDEGRSGDRTDDQYLESLRNLMSLRAGMPLDLCARRALDLRLSRRATATRIVSEGRFTRTGSVAWAVLDEEIDGAFFPALIPDASLIMLAVRLPERPGRWVMKLRLGVAAPDGLTLHSLGIHEWDPAFGGRWNAGSNKRGGGTMMEPRNYAAALRDAVLARAAGAR